MSGAGYFGFTPGATQYGTAAAAGSYPTAAPGGYAVSYAPTAAAATAAQYALTAAPTGYPSPYAAPAPPPPPAQPPAPPAFGAFTAGAAAQTAAAAAAAAAKPQSFTAPKSTPSQVSTYTGYDAAVYAAATSYLQSKAQGNKSQWLGLQKGSSNTASAAPAPARTSNRGNYGGGTGGGFPRKTTGGGGGTYGGRGGHSGGFNRNPQQLHYCEVCKISCAGPQTYREHLEGQKHKKKEAAAKTGSAQPLAKSKASFRCDLCSVTCTGQDTYQAHVRGAKHIKTIKLHQTLGKPIPSNEPVIIPPATAGAKPMVGTVTTDAAGKKVIGVPKMNFVGGTKLSTAGGGKDAAEKSEAAANQEAIEAVLALEKDVQPVGEDYVEPMKDHTGKVIQFFCKLCDCKFNDLNAKDMHLKGRRHRLQFKKKVNPELEVDLKPIPGGRGIQRRNEEKIRKELMRLRQQELWSMRAMYQSELAMPPSLGGPQPLFSGSGPGPRGPNPSGGPASGDTMDDRHVMAKHDQIYPGQDELDAVQRIVSNVEKALKGVSDEFAKADAEVETEETAAAKEAEAAEGKTEDKERLLKGVMRVGLLAKGLLLKGDLNLNLVVLCSSKPSKSILRRVMEHLPKQLEAVSEKESYDVTLEMEQAGIVVAATSEPRVTVRIVFTSVLMRAVELPEGATPGQSGTGDEPADMLDKAKCQAALADLRHAKWFQARCTNLQSCLVVLRMMRDICQRIPTWQPITTWALELLVEKVLTSAGVPLSPGEALRRIFEAVASGILLPSSPGLLDPCEKDVVDAAANLLPQQREDITSSAQHAMRLIAFNQLYKILGIERLPDKVLPPARKRPLETTSPANEGSASPSIANGKKDKKEEKMDEDAKPTA